MKRLFTCMMIVLFLSSMLFLKLNIQSVKSEWIGTVYIRADGRIDPPDAPIITYDNITYTLIDNITSSGNGIVVERDNIIIDGARHTLQGLWTYYSKGIDLTGRTNVTIKDVRVILFYYGIYLSHSSKITIRENYIAENGWSDHGCGIFLRSSSNNTILENNVTQDWVNGTAYGIRLENSWFNTIRRNVITNCAWNILLYSSHSNFLADNTMSGSFFGGFDFPFNFAVFGSSPEEYMNYVDESNTVNGKPIYYWVNEEELTVPSDAGCVILVNCTDITVQSLNLQGNFPSICLVNTKDSTITQNEVSMASSGIMLYFSSNNVISQNNVTGPLGNNWMGGICLISSPGNIIHRNSIKAMSVGNSMGGIWLNVSSNNIISENTITSYNRGICLEFSSGNMIYHNNFIDNTQQAYTIDSVNVWDDGYPSGGNYWSDYTGVDADGDGIGDTPYIIDVNNRDNYPLMSPYSDFTISVSPLLLSINQGESAICAVTLTSIGEFASEIYLSAFINPSTIDVTTTFNPTSVNLQAGGSANSALTISTTSNAPLKTFSITISASGGGKTKTAKLEVSLERFLEVPYQNQGQTGWCGPTSLAMILRYYGKEFHSWDYAFDENLPGLLGVSMEDLQKYVAENYPDLQTKIGYYYNPLNKDQILADIKSNVSSGFPVMLKVGTLSPIEGHYVVVVGYNESGLFINDPSGALFGSIIQPPLSYVSLNHAYVDWDTIEDHIQTWPVPSMMVISGTADPLPGTVYFTTWHREPDKFLESGIEFTNPNDKNDYHFLDLDRGLLWKDQLFYAVNPVINVDCSNLRAEIYVSNSKSVPQLLRASCSIVCPDGTERPLGVLEYEIDAFKQQWEHWYLNDLGNVLAKGGPYYIRFNLYDSTGASIDSFSTPPFYWGQGEIIRLEEKQQHLLLHAYDSQGNHVGLNYTTNQIDLEIPGSYYYDDMNGTAIIVLPQPANLTIVVDATYAHYPVELYSLTVFVMTDQGISSQTYNGTITSGEKQNFPTQVLDGQVVIVPEFPSFLILSIFIILTLLATIVLRKNKSRGRMLQYLI